MDTNNDEYTPITNNTTVNSLKDLSMKKIEYKSDNDDNSIISYAPDIFYDLRKKWLKKS